MSAADHLYNIDCSSMQEVGERVNNSWRECRKLQTPLSLLLLQVDYAQDAGSAGEDNVADIVIETARRVIKTHINRIKCEKLYMGDGCFALILPQTDEQDVESLGQSLRHHILEAMPSLVGRVGRLDYERVSVRLGHSTVSGSYEQPPYVGLAGYPGIFLQPEMGSGQASAVPRSC